LRRAGFDVTVVPMARLTHEEFLAWLEKVREAAAAVGEDADRAGDRRG
jgi:hypothetical protein